MAQDATPVNGSDLRPGNEATLNADTIACPDKDAFATLQTIALNATGEVFGREAVRPGCFVVDKGTRVFIREEEVWRNSFAVEDGKVFWIARSSKFVR